MKTLTAINLSIFAMILSGCAVTTAAVGGSERTVVRSLDDVSAGRVIKARMNRADEPKLRHVDVEVAEGIVVLTGNVPTQQDKLEAERIAWTAPNISKVGNEIRVAGSPGLVGNSKDMFLNNAIRTRLIADKMVKSTNYNIEAHDGTVYLLGVARSPQELERAAHIAATTKGTKEVISYVKLEGETVQSRAYAAAPVTTALPSPYSLSQTSPYSSQTGSPALQPLPEALTAQPALPQNSIAGETEPYFRDPVTGERVVLPPGTKTVPYDPRRHGAIPGKPPFYIDQDTGEKIQVVFRR
jgi:osmotically-inducible protein OsmY